MDPFGLRLQYAYLTATAATPPNSTPQTVGNSYTAATNLVRASESAVWTVDLTTGATTPKWTNPDGSTLTVELFIQSTALYSGGDAAQFGVRYPSPLTPYYLSFTDIGGGPACGGRGPITVTRTSDNVAIGYVSRTAIGNGQLKYVVEVADALIVTFQP